ncbi:hypothetical protein HFO43_02565 [Rhizobium leguminosarum]|uniref:hypothetical protein n=1 Tax=Rhizobium leguminosarum TaxID=384 RepID=UPI001C98A44A|nr:hypothetical protein [Rhizobium leguminosarum]MBY5667459.1 hypothetical protein [Rhizobium leguminosarum]
MPNPTKADLKKSFKWLYSQLNLNRGISTDRNMGFLPGIRGVLSWLSSNAGDARDQENRLTGYISVTIG